MRITNDSLFWINCAVVIMFIIVTCVVIYAIYFILTSNKRKQINISNRKAKSQLQSKQTNNSQSIAFIRHGEAIHNVNWRALDERDAHLTENGIKQVENLRNMIVNEFPKYFDEVELIVTSPLIRTLHTTLILIGSDSHKYSNKIIIQPLAAEHGYKLCDIGGNKNDVFSEFPQVKYFNNWNILEQKWWIYPETVDKFEKRAKQFKEWIQSRSENNILVVSHGGVIKALLSKSINNAELATVNWTRPE
eukprot:447187_1